MRLPHTFEFMNPRGMLFIPNGKKLKKLNKKLKNCNSNFWSFVTLRFWEQTKCVQRNFLLASTAVLFLFENGTPCINAKPPKQVEQTDDFQYLYSPQVIYLVVKKNSPTLLNEWLDQQIYTDHFCNSWLTTSCWVIIYLNISRWIIHRVFALRKC